MADNKRTFWFSSRRRISTTGSGLAPRPRALRLESLEDRRLLAISVNTLVDEDDGMGVGGVSLRDAIGAAVPGELIGFGVIGTINLVHGELVIPDELTITGPSSGLLTIDAQNNSRVFNIVAELGDLTLSGMTLTGGLTTADGGEGRGGAIRSETSGTLTLDDVVVRDNRTEGEDTNGGGISSSGDLTLNASTIEGNRTTGELSPGGGIFANHVTLTESTVRDNHTAGQFGSGGGISSADVTLNDSLVSGNTTSGAFGYGGGIAAEGDVTLTDSIVRDNMTTGTVSYGGGVSTLGAVTLARSTISGNHTTGDEAAGGGIYAVGDITLTESTVSGNSTTGGQAQGGGIFGDGELMLTGSTVSGNSTTGTSAGGGGIRAVIVGLTGSTVSGNTTTGIFASGGGILGGQVTISRSTVSGNTTEGVHSVGGGISARDFEITGGTITGNHANGRYGVGGGINALGDVTIRGSILAGNTGGSKPDLQHEDDAIVSVRYSLIGDATGTSLTPTGLSADFDGNLIGEADAPIDARLGPLADNGGPTRTHALQPDSPAKDAGNPNIFFDPNQFDQRGDPFIRVDDGRIDMGSVDAVAEAIDLDGNAGVDRGDVAVLVGFFGATSGATSSQGDLDGDGRVSLIDLLMLRQLFDSPGSSPQAVMTSETAAPSPAAATTLDIATDEAIRELDDTGEEDRGTDSRRETHRHRAHANRREDSRSAVEDSRPADVDGSHDDRASRRRSRRLRHRTVETIAQRPSHENEWR